MQLRGPDGHQHMPEEERRIREAALDRTIAGSFPASDPPSSIPNPYDHDAFAETPRPQSGDRPQGRGTTATAITVDEVKRLLDQKQPITFIDSRNPIAWGSSRVKLPGAIRVPLDEVDTRLSRLPRDRRLIVYCT